MKYAALSLAVIFGVCLIVTGYLFLTCDVRVNSLGASVRNASDDPVTFSRINDQIVYGGGEDLGDISGYVFYSWRIGVSNTTFAPLEMVQASISQAPGDIAMVSRNEPIRIEARTDGEIEITVLSRVNAGARRSATVSWRLWGREDSLPLRVE
ncbi:MAG: hypothetical protein IJK28_12065 [Clostridia bacterium]|nr:hypothetical protein [Clostridia bacterium]